MTTHLVGPRDAAQILRRRIARQWPDAVCAELNDGQVWRTTVALSPGVTSGERIGRLGFGAVHDWTQAWLEVPRTPGIDLVHRRVSVARVEQEVPATLVVTGLDAAWALLRMVGGGEPDPDVARARTVAARMRNAGATLTPATLGAVHALADPDVEVVLASVAWLASHADISAWTARQLPVPGMHSKWLATHGALLRDLVGRDVRAQVRPRLAVVHMTYVDPAYLASGGRRHDAWTTGDTHEPVYAPRTVLIVENRDCRLWFPPLDATIVVEGGGKAASTLLADVDWLRRAPVLAYWGDIDADGFAILDHLRSMLSVASEPQPITSILMDGRALDRYSHLGVNAGVDGRALGPATAQLPHLTADEREAYHAVATAGPAPVRRIEQERIPLIDAAHALTELVAPR